MEWIDGGARRLPGVELRALRLREDLRTVSVVSRGEIKEQDRENGELFQNTLHGSRASLSTEKGKGSMGT